MKYREQPKESRLRRGFFAPVQTGPGTHPRASFLEVKRAGRDVNHPAPSSTEVKERVELYLYFPVGLHSRLKGEVLLYLPVLHTLAQSPKKEHCLLLTVSLQVK
jgi:hypothetical protein